MSTGEPAAAAWDHTNCTGTAGCPPRCPRFVDRAGAPLLVRPFQDTDRDALLEFYDGYPSAHRSMSLPPLGRQLIESWLDRLLERGRHLVAHRDDELVGHVAYSPRSEPVVELVVFVDPAYHDRGIGTELCRHAVAHAAADDHEALQLYVDRANERAIHVYESLGFQAVEDTGDDLLEMRLDLDDGVVSEYQAFPADRN